jgi:alpha-tubulin suppressor-like RCC1 family protein
LVSSLRTTPIKMVTCGRMHTVVVTESGSVMSWGKGDRGALGLGDSMKRSDVPQALDNVGRAYGQPVVGVACSTEHTAIVTANGRYVSFSFSLSFKLFLWPI